MRENAKLQTAFNARLRNSVCDKCLAKACLSIPSREIRGKGGYLSVYHLLGTNCVPDPLPSALYTVFL